MGILITVLALAIGWWVYEWLIDELEQARWRQANKDRLRRRP